MPQNKLKMSTVFFDIDTQIDFMLPTGALYVPGAENIIPIVAALNRQAPIVISSMCAHSEDDLEFPIYGHHCVVGTVGQQKPAATLLNDPARQFFMPKQELNVFSNPDLLPLLKRLNADSYVVYGVVTEICVQFAAFGLLETGKPVTLVTDAIRSLDDSAGAETIARFTEAGGRLVTSQDLLA